VKLAPPLRPVIRNLGGDHLNERTAGRRLEIGQRRQLPGRPVNGVLDDTVADVDLFDAPRCQLEQLREHELRLLAADPDREPDHRCCPPSVRRRRA
jgi:hypothetical protein